MTQQQNPINSQAPQDIVIQSGFLNHFRWATQEQRSGWAYINKSDGKDQNGNTQYRSVFCQVFGNAARMLESYYSQIQSAKQQGQRMSVLVQFHMATCSSFNTRNDQGQEGQAVNILKGFKAYILDPQTRNITDFSDDVRWNAQQGGGYQQAPAQQAPAQQSGGYQQAPTPKAPAQQSGGQQNAPMAEPDFDFDDDIPF